MFWTPDTLEKGFAIVGGALRLRAAYAVDFFALAGHGRGSHSAPLEPSGTSIGSAQASGVSDISTCQPRRVISQSAHDPQEFVATVNGLVDLHRCDPSRVSPKRVQNCREDSV
jgi:hypothetical protein